MHEQTIPVDNRSEARREAPTILDPTGIAEADWYKAGSLFKVPADVEYRGHRIVWDARPVEGSSLWTGRAAIVAPADSLGVKSIYRICVNDYFTTEKQVMDHLVSAAKERIDSGLEL